MTSATTIVNDALALLNLNSNILNADPAHQERGFNQLVSLLHRLRGDGMRIVRQFPAAITADLKEPSWATDGLRFELAASIAPFLRGTVSDGFADIRAEAMRVLANNARPPISCQLPDNLPVGAGNYDRLIETFFQPELDVEYEIYASVFAGESGSYYADFDYDADTRGTTVSSVAWSNQGTASASISGASVTGNVASAVLAFPTTGSVLVRARATYVNGQIHDYTFRIEVTDVA